MKWRGRFGYVVLGPTEHRVARYLEAATRYGLVTIPTSRLIDELGLARSEAFRITRRLRTLGLFGIENDQGGARGGRRIWRTAKPDGQRLDRAAHRLAWARITAALRAARDRILEAVRKSNDRPVRYSAASDPAATQPTAVDAIATAVGPPRPLLEAMLRLAPALASEWRLERGA